MLEEQKQEQDVGDEEYVEVHEEDEDFDMFSTNDKPVTGTEMHAVKRRVKRVPKPTAVIETGVNLAENWDDAEGYYMVSCWLLLFLLICCCCCYCWLLLLLLIVVVADCCWSCCCWFCCCSIVIR